MLQETAREAGLPRPFGFQMISPQAPDDKHGPAGFGVCLAGFLDLPFLAMFLCLLFGIQFIPNHGILEVCGFFFIS